MQYRNRACNTGAVHFRWWNWGQCRHRNQALSTGTGRCPQKPRPALVRAFTTGSARFPQEPGAFDRNRALSTGTAISPQEPRLTLVQLVAGAHAVHLAHPLLELRLRQSTGAPGRSVAQYVRMWPEPGESGKPKRVEAGRKLRSRLPRTLRQLPESAWSRVASGLYRQQRSRRKRGKSGVKGSYASSASTQRPMLVPSLSRGTDSTD